MKILHICLNGPYTEGLNYQENLLTKFQKKEGHDVFIIASEWMWNKEGKIQQVINKKYVNDNGVTVYRIPIKKNKNVFYSFKKYEDFYSIIHDIKPEIIFVHGIQFFDIKTIKKYAKKYDVKVYIDNHSDFSNTARTLMKKIFYKTVWKHYAKLIEPYTIKFWGVLPARVDFLIKMYGLPKQKCDLLVMGANDEFVKKYSSEKIKIETRKELKIKEDEFIIVTGGKIDKFKLQTILLMKAVKKINKNIKLIIFGSIEDEIKNEFEEICDNNKIKYIGWISEEESYKYFSIANLVIFPGRHSVYWEQVVAMGIPMVCKYWEGTTHIDIGGNVIFLHEDTIEEMENIIIKLFEDKNKYNEILNNAKNKEKNKFLYSSIAIKSIK